MVSYFLKKKMAEKRKIFQDIHFFGLKDISTFALDIKHDMLLYS